jgi:hypothetical protein
MPMYAEWVQDQKKKRKRGRNEALATDMMHTTCVMNDGGSSEAPHLAMR